MRETMAVLLEGPVPTGKSAWITERPPAVEPVQEEGLRRMTSACDGLAERSADGR